jgi:cytoskeleton protein RodZ
MEINTNMENMGTLGAYLKKTRELHGISIEELASSTKINISILAAIESDDFKKLPAPIFVKGFIKSYLKYLGVDPKEAILFYELLSSPTRKQDNKIDDISDREGVKINKYKVKMSIRLVITALSVVVLVLSLVVYHLYSKTSKTQNEPLSEDKLVLNMSDTKAPEAVAPATAPTPSPVAEQKPVMPLKTTLVVKAPATPAAVITQKIVITATADLWVKVKIDDGKPFDFLLRTGGIKKLEGTKEIKILLGDASAGTIEYNGEVMKNLGEKGFMRSIVFPGLGKWQDALVR